MNRSFIPLSWSVVLGLLVCSCQARQATQVNPPTQTPVPVITATPTLTDQPSPTVTSQPPAQPTCFQTSFVPVGLLPGSHRLLMRGGTGMQIFNLDTLKEVTFLKSPTNLNGPVVALSPDGKSLAWALEDYSIQWVRVADQQVLATFTGHTDRVTRLRFSPDGALLFSASHDGWVRVWSAAGAQVNSFQPGGGEIVGIGISPDGKTLATIPADGPVKLWETLDFHELADLGGTGGYDTSDVAFSPDGKFIAADLATGLSVWDSATHTQVWAGANSMAFAFSPAGNMLAYADINQNNDILLVSPDGKQKLNTFSGHAGPVFELVFSPDGSLLASADDSQVRIWRVKNGQLLYIGKSECP